MSKHNKNRYERKRKYQLYRQQVECFNHSNKWVKKKTHHKCRRDVNVKISTQILGDYDDFDLVTIFDKHYDPTWTWFGGSWVQYGRGDDSFYSRHPIPRRSELWMLPQWMRHRMKMNRVWARERAGLPENKTKSRFVKLLPKRIDKSSRAL